MLDRHGHVMFADGGDARSIFTSRAVEQRGGKPRLSDLRDSGSIEQDADVVMFIHREDKYKEDSDKPNIAEILIEKHRNGPTGKVELYFDDRKTSFLSIEKSDFGEWQAKAAATASRLVKTGRLSANTLQTLEKHLNAFRSK